MAVVYMKSGELWKHLRPPVRTWVKAAGFERVQSSPPCYGRELSGEHQTVWLQAGEGARRVAPRYGCVSPRCSPTETPRHSSGLTRWAFSR